MAKRTHLYKDATMQQIIDLVAKLQIGESKKYSELRSAIALITNTEASMKRLILISAPRKGNKNC
ncbi:MAG: hypothetical protein HC815_36055 [Richelia sp. RM1_1_1]|nr:hypothetical protein [Richelia sp. RM1_1_1]